MKWSTSASAAALSYLNMISEPIACAEPNASTISDALTMPCHRVVTRGKRDFYGMQSRLHTGEDAIACPSAATAHGCSPGFTR